MRILYLTNHLNTGGISSYLLTLTKGVKDLGHEFFVLGGSGNLSAKFEQAGGKVLDSAMRLKSDGDLRVYFVVPHLKFFQLHKIDVVHSQTRVTQIMGEHYSRRLGVPHVSTCHGFFKNRLSRRLFPCWGRKVIAISQPVFQHLREDFKVPEQKIALIPNGIDLSQFYLPSQSQRDEIRQKYKLMHGPVIGIIARLSDVKGHDVLVHAFRLVLNDFPNATLMIVGEGPMEDPLHRLVEGLDLTKHVQFLKVVDRTAELLPLFDVFVMPSLQEGLGLSVLEAQAMGLPVVASRVGGLPDIIEHNRTGLLVEPRNPQALAQGIVEILSHPAKAWDMGRAARMFVEKNYSSARMVRSTINLYEQLVLS